MAYQLGELEELTLMMVALLQDEAYGVRVMDEIASEIGRKINISAIHTVLDRLEKKRICGFLHGRCQQREGRTEKADIHDNRRRFSRHPVCT